MKHFIQAPDFNEIQLLLQWAKEAKIQPFADQHLGKNKTLGLIFLNPSLRTRMSTQKAGFNLGMNVMVLNMGQEAWQLESREGVIMDGDKAEHAKEAIAVMGQYCDILGVRTFPGLKDKSADYGEEMLGLFLRYAGVPVVSLESATRHPLQSFADLLTIEELKKVSKPKIVLTWAPHIKALPQAVPNSFAEWMLKAGHDLVITHPEGYELDPQFTQGAEIEYDQQKALQDADFVYVKNWSAFSDYGQVLTRDPEWMMRKNKWAYTANASVMHCLPVRRNVVMSDDILDSPASVVIRQAGNREFAAQAALKYLLT
jgi:N-succinyl-L-ornithine transcarbamylase